jgi:eukaryotic-like serine/threonine-protein kinase
MPLATGTRLGPYEIVTQVGAGGMGEVYSARDTRLDRVVAIKVLPLHRSDQADARERFEREGRAIAALNHPHICQLYDVGSEGSINYLVLEFLRGETLADRLVRGPFALSELLRCALEVTDALDTAHRKGIIHRDLKPGNIFLTAHGEYKVLDFGLAKLVDDAAPESATATVSPVTVAGTAVGTIAYMSPEQARGEALDERTDIFSFGTVLYEMATGKPAFHGKTSAVIFKAILDDTPTALSQRNPILPARLDDIVSKALEKDPSLRYQSAAELRADLQRLKRDSESGRMSAQVPQRQRPMRGRWFAALAVVLVAAAGFGLYYYLGRRHSARSTAWEQLTFFTDSAVYPALSPDGRMLAFIRGSGTFFGRGDIYVKLLPSGDAVQLTHDSGYKLAPVFSPDGSRIAYGTIDPFDTWEVPVLGGQPRLLLKNASSLSWIDNGKHLLFSEILGGLHMILVTTNQDRGERREVYVPPGERSMVHHAYLSPDGRWVLMVLMDESGSLLPCQVVPFDGQASVRVIGPSPATCTSAAWSPDGNWVYFSANPGGRFHIWRQKFPDGPLQQVTSGTTEEEGIAMSPDGQSLLTSVGAQDATIWLHDASGDHQLSSEGSAWGTTISWDKSKLYYEMQGGQSPGVDLWVRDLASGSSERVISGSAIQPGSNLVGYALSHDGKTVALSVKNDAGLAQIWLAPVDHRSSPRLLVSPTSQDSPGFLPNGDLVLRSIEGSQNFLYRTAPDGTGRRKVTPDPILDLISISPDGRWAVASVKSNEGDHPAVTAAFPLEGGPTVNVCTFYCNGGWDISGSFFFVIPADLKTYVLPVSRGRGLPDFPTGDLSADGWKADKRVMVIPRGIDSAAGPDYYSYTRANTRRNIYRIPLPD